MLFINLVFCYDLYVAIFLLQISLLPSYPVTTLSLHHFPLLLGRILLRYFGISYFVFTISSYHDILLAFLLSPVHSDLSLRVASFVLIVLLCSFCLNVFLRFILSSFVCCRRYLTCVSSLISHAGFGFLFVFFRGTLMFSQTNFAPA